ncbi:MAG TPA: hypothetical protein DHV17_04970 [Chitinophagaceae bacterium]|nr:hypothetical protein [Chitinophagaceae bacterium]
MGESDRYQDYRRPKKRFSLGQDNNALMALFSLNVIGFLILMLAQVVFFFYQQTPTQFNEKMVQWIALPSDLKTFSERPWTLITYMFTDTGAGLMRLLSNMLWLWAFGYILQQMSGNDKIIPVYIYGGLAGALFFILSHYLLPPLRNLGGQQFIIGANAGTMAVAMATTTLAPNYRFFTQIRGGIPIWVLMLAYLIINFAGVAGMNAAYSLSHMGGALAGFLFVFFLKKGYDGSTWMNRFYHKMVNMFSPAATPDKKTIREKVFYQSGGRSPYKKSTIITQQRIDEILDKINQKGYHFLTEEEKQILKKAAEEDNL